MTAGDQSMSIIASVLMLVVCAAVACAVSGAGEYIPRPVDKPDMARVRIGSSHVVDQRGDVWLVRGFNSDTRGLLVDGCCANESGVCHGRRSALVPLTCVVEVRP